jgi:quercetin dioxygenase-like cupin family protein
MKKIVSICSFALICFVGCKSNKISDIKVTTLAKTTKSWNGKLLPKYLEGKPEITILKIIIPPKTTLPLHKHPEINAGILLKGNLRVISKDNDTLNLKQGETIVELVNTWHFGENLGNEPVEIVVFYAGVEGTPITILKEGSH